MHSAIFHPSGLGGFARRARWIPTDADRGRDGARVATMITRALAIISLTAAVIATPDTLLADDARLTLVYTGRFEGEIEPCGCTVGSDLGGIRRLASAIDAIREESPDAVLISAGGLLGTRLPAHQVSNAFLLEGVALLDYDAIGLQWDDLIYGSEAHRAVPLPWVASNWRTDEFDRVRVIDRDELRIAYLQWLPPALSPYAQLPAGQHRVFGDIASLGRQLLELRRQGIVTVLGTFGMEAPLEGLPLELIDVLLLPETREPYGTPVRTGDTWVLRPGSRGQRVAQLQLRRGADGIWNLQAHRVVELDNTITEATRFDGWHRSYNDALAEEFRQRAMRAQSDPARGLYVGNTACAACHEEQIAQWQGTDHARALTSLKRVGKEFDANCVQCHTVGFGQVGGYHAEHARPDLRHVGCEACHGPAKPHVASGGAAPLASVTGRLCRNCHDESHSPGFDLRTGWSRIEH